MKLFVFSALLLSNSGTNGQAPQPPAKPASPAPSASSEKPQRVTVGAFLRNVEGIDLQNNRYHLSFDLWLKWKGTIDPTKSIKLRNVIEADTLTMKAVYPKPLMIEGQNYQRYEVEGKFFHKFWLGTFPLDWQRITLELEDPMHTTNKLVYVPDKKDSGVHSYLKIPGWNIVEVTNQTWDHSYKTDFGMGAKSLGRKYPGYRFGLRIERPVSFFFFKIFPPILITLACCLMVFLLNPSYVDARVGTPIAGLLTAVFLQLTFTGNLPSVGTMLLIDHVFNFSYFVIFMVLLECIITAKMIDKISVLEAEGGSAKKIEALYARIARFDKRALLGLPMLYILGVLAVTRWVRGAYLMQMLDR